MYIIALLAPSLSSATSISLLFVQKRSRAFDVSLLICLGIQKHTQESTCFFLSQPLSQSLLAEILVSLFLCFLNWERSVSCLWRLPCSSLEAFPLFYDSEISTVCSKSQRTKNHVSLFGPLSHNLILNFECFSPFIHPRYRVRYYVCSIFSSLDFIWKTPRLLDINFLLISTRHRWVLFWLYPSF